MPACVENRSRKGEGRVLAVSQPGGAGVIGSAGEVETQAAVRPDALTDRHCSVTVGQCTALLDMQLDKHTDQGQCLVVPAELMRVVSGRSQRLSEAGPIGIGQPPSLIWIKDTGQQPRADTRHPEPRALLVGETNDGDRAAAAILARTPGVLRAEQVDGTEGRYDPERSIEGATVGHAVQVASGHHRARPRIPPPRPKIAVAVYIDRHTAGRGRLVEPLSRLPVGR